VPDIERALALDPKNAEAYFVKGRLLRNTHRAGAEEAFRRAVELDPSHAAATLSLGYSAVSHGRIDERHRLALRARDLDPMDLNNHEAVMMSAGALGRAEELHASVERMQSVFPDHPRATGLACQAWSQLGQPDEALACIAVGRATFADNAGFLAAMDELAGQASEALGDDTQALRFYERSGEPLLALRLRHDIPGVEKAATEALAEPPSPFGGAPAYVLARAGLTSEALAVYRHAGTAALMASDQWFKIAVLNEVTQLEEADRLLARLTVFAEALHSHGARNSYQRLYYAKVQALAGHEDAAIEQISLAVDALDSPFFAGTTETELEFDELRHDPGFKAQMKRLRERQAEIRARLPETFRRHGLDWPPESAVR
jgi:tetratricopeptide (TPR) repeat protein